MSAADRSLRRATLATPRADTGLAMGRRVARELERAWRALLRLPLRQARRAPMPTCAPMTMSIDIERLQAVRDGLGPHAGERLLSMLAERVRAVLRTEDTVMQCDPGRLVAVLHGAMSPEEALAIAHRTVRTLQAPIVVQGYRVVVGARVAFGGLGAPGADAATAAEVAANDVRIPVQFHLEHQPRFLEIVRESGRGTVVHGAMP